MQFDARRWPAAFGAKRAGRSQRRQGPLSGGRVASHFFAPAAKYRNAPNGGRNPHWRADGKKLFYLTADGTMMAVSIDVAADAVTGGAPKALFQAGAISRSQVYAVTRDGQRFLVSTRPRNAPAPTPLTVVVNWSSALQK